MTLKNLVADLMYKSLHRIMSDVAMLLMIDAKLMSFYFRMLRSPFTPFFTM